MCLSCTIEEITGLDLSTDEGHDALEKLGRIPWPHVTPVMEEAASYIAALYNTTNGGVGGPVHIVTDDYNVDDDSLLFCRGEIKRWTPYEPEHGDGDRVKALATWILDLLEPMSVVERSVTVALAHDDIRVLNGRVFMPATEFPIRENVFDDDGNIVGFQWGFRNRTSGETTVLL
jgi:hypothetical protein